MIPNAQQLAPLAGPQSLLGVALPLQDGWESGVSFGSGQCAQAHHLDPCPEGYVGTTDSLDVLTFAPFESRVGVACTALTGDAAQNAYARGTSAASLDPQLATVLLDGTGINGSNPFLKETETLFDTGTVAEAISCLERHAAATLYGRQVLLHVPPALGPYIAPLVFDRNGALFTAAGSQVVVSAGNAGHVPDFYDPGEEETEYAIYVTGSIWAAVGEPRLRSVLDVDINEQVVYVSAPALVAFDPCSVAAALSGITIDCPVWEPPGE